MIGLVDALQSLLAFVRALWELIGEWLHGEWQLNRHRLTVRTTGVDPKQVLSHRGGALKAFCDGSVIASGGCGIAVFYTDGHPLNCHGGFDPCGPPADSNLAELVALFFAVLHHPRGQHLSVFSDSAHALRLIESFSVGHHASGGSTKRQKRQGRAPDPRELCVGRALHWLLRLRHAQSCFFKACRSSAVDSSAVGCSAVGSL